MRQLLTVFTLTAVLLLTGCAGRPPQASPPVPPTPAAAPQPEPVRMPSDPPYTGVSGPCRPSAPAAKAGTTQLSVYFTCNGVPYAVPRQVTATQQVLRTALEELLKGPSSDERTLGFHSFFSPATASMLRSVTLTAAGRAVVDFADLSRVIPNASTSHGSQEFTAELNRTLFQFPSVKEAEYRFNGSCPAFWEWLQFGCHVVPAPAPAELALTDRANQTILALQQSDWTTLGTIVHPTKGVRFSPYANVHSGPNGDLVFKGADLKSAAASSSVLHWGAFDGSGKPMDLTFAQYEKQFVYDVDFARAPQIGWDKPIGEGNTINNLTQVYPGDRFIEYHFPGFDPKYQGMDWKSLRLVFENQGGTWYLVGIVHAQWTT